jgi:glycosyltransferase involved in cell wall biosynthesis
MAVEVAAMSTDRPMVSVVIPCFNAERWIGDTIESIYRQTWPTIELVVVNDGSTDGSLAEIERQKSPKLTIIDQDNRGQAAAFNVALKRCNGFFVQYLDADDGLAPGKIERQVQGLGDTVDAVATSSWRVISSAAALPLEDVPRGMNGANKVIAPADWLVETWHDGGGMMFPAMWLAPKRLVDRVGGWAQELTLFIDTEYFTRLVLSSSAVISCPDAQCYYRKGHQSVSGLRTPAAWKSGFRAIDLSANMLLAAETSDRTKRVASFLWQRFANSCFPYDRAMGTEAERRARALHQEQLSLPGGPVYNLIASTLGWKVARSLQVLLGRP